MRLPLIRWSQGIHWSKDGFSLRHATVHGRLGVICIVHLDGDPNTLFPLPVLYVSPSNVPDPTILAVAAEDIGPLKDYTLTGYKEHRGRDGYGFNATLRKDCKPIAEVLNEG